jgi:hypothetical protein
MLNLATSLTFALTGLSKDKQVYSALGSGFFVAPYTAVTAAHVLRGLWDNLEMPWKKGKYPKSTVEPEFYLAAIQQVDANNAYLSAQWEITGATPLQYTDVALLNVAPKNEVALNFIWPKLFPHVQLLPPEPNEEVWAFGYPGLEHGHVPGEDVIEVSAEPTLLTGEVVGVFPDGRGSWKFPQFEVTCPFEPGMSGGPVFQKDRICGLVSYGPTLEQGKRGPSFAASLWPILASEQLVTIDPRTAKNAVLDMIATGAVIAPGWKQIQTQITTKTDAQGDILIALKS